VFGHRWGAWIDASWHEPTLGATAGALSALAHCKRCSARYIDTTPRRTTLDELASALDQEASTDQSVSLERKEVEWLARIARKAIDERVQPLFIKLDALPPGEDKRRAMGLLHSILNTLCAIHDAADEALESVASDQKQEL
jgi:hypothetical protein